MYDNYVYVNEGVYMSMYLWMHVCHIAEYNNLCIMHVCQIECNSSDYI